MKSLWSILRLALRAAVWKSTPDASRVGLPCLLAWAVLAFGSDVLEQFISAGAGARFTPYGLSPVIVSVALALAVTAIFVRADDRATVLCGGMALSVLLSLFRILLTVTPAGLWNWATFGGAWTTFIVWYVVHLVWCIGSMFALLRSADPQARNYRFRRVVVLVFSLFLVEFAIPHYPIFKDRNFDIRSANYWEFIPTLLGGSDSGTSSQTPTLDSARIELAQPSLLETAIARLAPQRRGKTDIYTIGIAGWSGQNVFRSEVWGALSAMAGMLPIEARSLTLINHPDTVADLPIATHQNVAAAIRAVGRVMNKDEDVLMLIMSSHGSRDGLALHLPGVVSASFAPDHLAELLQQEGIKHRIVIVSACYSGVFLKPLADENTIVMSAADENSTSFGCSNEREWTYFGDALFNHAARAGVDLQRAFEQAKLKIEEWEARDGLSASNPQAHFGEALVAKLKPIQTARTSALQ